MEGQHRGVTLLELLVTLSITAVILGYAIPSAMHLVATTRLGSETSRFLNSYNSARLEAITRDTPISLCSSNGLTCSNINDWSTGWLVFNDTNNNQQSEPDEILSVNRAIADGYLFSPNINAAQLVFYRNGRVRRVGGGLPLMTFRLCAPNAVDDNIRHYAREMVINGGGRIRLQAGRPGITDCS